MLRLPPSLASVVERLDDIGFERVRRAFAALVLSLFVSLFLLGGMNAPPEIAPLFWGLGACYLIGFIAVVAEWFWGRWYADGLCWSGVMVSIASLVMLGWTPVLAIYGGLHAAVIALLAGKRMLERYDLQPAWRERYQMDDLGVARLRKTVTRASASLPSLIVYLLGPKEGQGLALATGLAALALTAIGLRGVIRLRSWGVVALGGAAVTSGLTLLMTLGATVGLTATSIGTHGFFWFASALLAFAALTTAVAPFIPPALRFLRRR